MANMWYNGHICGKQVMLMIKNRLIKMISLTLVIVMVLGCFTSTLATSTPDQEIGEAYVHLSEDGDDGVYKTLRQITNILTIFAFMICAFKLAQIGFKFMFGVANKRSDAMQSLLPWGLGVFICTMWLTLGNWVMNMLADPGNGLTPTGPFDIPSLLGNIFMGII